MGIPLCWPRQSPFKKETEAGLSVSMADGMEERLLPALIFKIHLAVSPDYEFSCYPI